MTPAPLPDPAALRALLATLEAAPLAEAAKRDWHACKEVRDIEQDLHCDLGLCRRDQDGAELAYEAPAYLTSLDAARRAVMHAIPDAHWSVEASGCAWIRVGDADVGDAWNLPEPAQALVAAGLRALLARCDMEDGHGG